ncbi:fluoride efflux transporter CrcB [bacterium]|nr:fluoride efflux transporter CrcB [bacterium]|tara:strand:+ start:70 stop:441 length:372 start_codon:yes stop_codon:yes gene_type:complete
MINILITIGIGGALGAITRYLSGVWLSLVIPNKPYVSTLFVNVIGSLLIGLFYLISEHMIIKDNIRLLFVVGFLGSLTTFSTFSYEFMTMINEKNYLLAISYILLNILLSGILIYIFFKFTKN